MTSVPMVEQTAGRKAADAAKRRRERTGARPPRPGRPGRGRKTGGYNRRPGFLTYGLLGAVILGSALPILWSVLVASHDSDALASGMTLLPGGNFFINAATVLDSIPFWKALGNSVLVSTVTAASVVIFSSLAGFAFAKLRFRGSKVLLVFVVATMAVPTQLGVVPLFIVMSKLGWTGTMGAVIVPGLVTAFGVFWMTQYLRDALPDELIEAVRMDGANMWQAFWHVALPAGRPAAAMLALFTFVATWTNFFWPFIVLNAQNPTLPVALSQLQSARFVDYSVVLAGVVLSTIPLFIVFAVAGRHLVAGIMQGAVKG
ncbi:carbohydrate ABC transporter permease [Arthrobacter zhangbolii]|uniref:Carbohydrate ABC transporter permease n=1 Tax=Arthrobacter zhangbolii TaxID=2886936 RepID=A0A9X1M701_9MICC|nr:MULTISPECIES: carbohydrate ABC transporter permease [Arthrobacter]MCC3272559.1 carbohydrate ABC transporter permease [Arthrobacter zhangbolii]MCC3293957.1 carbohydrate ABC transporter permease [Arthrobacter zhangbolii]MDN3903624.1 carbohydrate ABC transporter permease [Arthrobacter sp. YD2]UON91590.1 carbohydrate ABC transporter permease [Arthrobacter zhangbolii]